MEEESAFFGKGCCEVYGCKAAEKKKTGKNSSKVRMPVAFVKGSYFGTPLCTTCKINRVGDKGRSMRNRERSW
jgi:hypothetical protein